MQPLSFMCFVGLFLVYVAFAQEEECVYGLLYPAANDAGEYYCAYYCFDLSTGNYTISDAKTRSFAEIKAVCPNIQATIDLFGSTTCSSTSDLVWDDSCYSPDQCPVCPCAEESGISYHETAYFFKKECTVCECTAYNSASDKGWSCVLDTYSVSNPYEWDHFSCDSEILCSSDNPTNYNTYTPGDVWWESSSFDASCETFCYCQYDGTTYCETSYADIVSSPQPGLQYGFFELCTDAIGCQNDPDLLNKPSSYDCGCPTCSCSSGTQYGDVEYVEFTPININASTLTMFGSDEDTHCMECSCMNYRNCDQYGFESYPTGTEACPPISNGQCSTGEGNSTAPSDANDGAGLTLTDCYGSISSGAYCGWSLTAMTDSLGNNMFNEPDVSWGCEDDIFCDGFQISDGACFHLEIDYTLLAGLDGCEENAVLSNSVYADLTMNLYQMCCTGSTCNNVEANTASCADNAELQDWYDTYLQCVYGDEYQLHFCQARDAFTCTDLQALGAWSIGCDCAAMSTMYGRVSTTKGQQYFAQEIGGKIAELEAWSDVFGCSLLFSCDLSSGESSVSASQPTAATQEPTSVTTNPSLSPTVGTDAPSVSPTKSPTIGTSVPTLAPTGVTSAPSVITDNPTSAPSDSTSAPTAATDGPTAVTLAPTAEGDMDPSARGGSVMNKCVSCFVVLFVMLCFLF